MWKIISDISGNVHEYAGGGRWVASDGLRFGSEADANTRLQADLSLINPRIRPAIRVVAA